jgi:hypothetical protein
MSNCDISGGKTGLPAGLDGRGSQSVVRFLKGLALAWRNEPFTEAQLSHIEALGRNTLTDEERATLRRVALAWFAD